MWGSYPKRVPLRIRTFPHGGREVEALIGRSFCRWRGREVLLLAEDFYQLGVAVLLQNALALGGLLERGWFGRFSGAASWQALAR